MNMHRVIGLAICGIFMALLAFILMPCFNSESLAQGRGGPSAGGNQPPSGGSQYRQPPPPGPPPGGGQYRQPPPPGQPPPRQYYPPRGSYYHGPPRGSSVVFYGGVNYYYGGGAWYRPYGPSYVVVAPPFGVVVPALPPYYATVWVGGAPYYYANEIYYAPVPGGYMVVEAPKASPAPPPVGPEMPSEAKVFIYPNQGQDEKQQADDRYDCHRWAVSQTGYDPTQPPPGLTPDQSSQKRADYRRAMGACLEGRGYTVK